MTYTDNEKSYFIPTQKYKEYFILNLISNDSKISQRTISKELGIAVSMVNMYLNKYEEEGYINKKYHSSKEVEYLITKKGITRKELLNVGYLNEAQKKYNEAKNTLLHNLNDSKVKGYKNIILYGAGEIAEILLAAIKDDKNIGLNILGIIDDDKAKQGLELMDKKIMSLDEAKFLDFDCIVISTYLYNEKIFNHLINEGINKERISLIFEK